MASGRTRSTYCSYLVTILILVSLTFLLMGGSSYDTGLTHILLQKPLPVADPIPYFVNSSLSYSNKSKSVIDTHLKYTSTHDGKSVGKPFNITPEYWKAIGMPPKEFAVLDENGTFWKKMVFVTAASANHYEESLDAVASVQKFFPGRKIIYYDLGLNSSQKEELEATCDVEYRVFNFSKYPAHVAEEPLGFCIWKFLMIMEVFFEHDGLFWMDASVRLRGNHFDGYTKEIYKSKGFGSFTHTGHSNYAVTHPMMYEYLPTDIEKQKGVEQWQAGDIVVFNTKELYENVLKWAYACSLVKECIAPVRKQRCKFPHGVMKVYANCHRYDQAMVNLLLSNWWHFQRRNYSFGQKSKSKLYDVIRHVTSSYNVTKCGRT